MTKPVTTPPTIDLPPARDCGITDAVSPMPELDDILDDLFHGAAFAAYLDEAALAKGPPCPQKTRQRAYRYYEEWLAEKNAAK
ncbi:MAG: hypothetical protein AB7F89_11745 [Pirellulaceae bacterium]